MEFIEFKDVKVVPDPVHPYTDILRSSGLPIVIDNGIMFLLYETNDFVHRLSKFNLL